MRSYLAELTPKDYAAFASVVIAIASFVMSLRTSRRTNNLVKSQRRQELMTDIFGLQSKLVEAGLLLDEADFEVLKLKTVLHSKGRDIPEDIQSEYERAAERYREDFVRFETDFREVAVGVEARAPSMSLKELEDAALVFRASHADCDSMIKTFSRFKTGIQGIHEFDSALHE